MVDLRRTFPIRGRWAGAVGWGTRNSGVERRGITRDTTGGLRRDTGARGGARTGVVAERGWRAGE